MEEGTEAAEGGSELVGVVGRRIFELLEEGVDGGADFRVLRRLCVFAVGDIERVEGHGGLLGSAFVGDGDIFGVIGDALEHTEGDGLIVLHGGETIGDLLGERRGGEGGVGDEGSIRIEFAHLRGDNQHLAIEFLGGGRIDLLGEVAEDRVARCVPGRIAGAAALVAVLLAPTIFCRSERMVAGEAGKLGVFGPDIFFVGALVVGSPGEALHGSAQLRG